jgi:hypothetical protein
MAHAVEVALEQIMAYNKAEGKTEKSKILLLGRFGFDGDQLEKSGCLSMLITATRCEVSGILSLILPL